jgi:hypothetical protein
MREQLLALLRGGNAHMGFDQAVAGFPTKHFNSRPPNVPYSPWHLIEHMRIAQWDILEFVRDPDHVSPDWPEGYWPAPDERADAARWQKSISDFGADLKTIQDLVADPGTDLLSPIPHAEGYTILREILLVADHNAYHIGELAILRQVIDAWSAE